MHTGERIDLDVTHAAHGGVFVGRHEGRVVFVPDAIPGERVRVALTDTSTASFWRGDVLEVLDASPHRRPHVWAPADVSRPPADRPGGADFGHIALAQQRELKAGLIEDALVRIGGIHVPVSMSDAGEDESPDGTRWRTRVSLHVDDAGRVGPYAARSHRVIPVDDLPLATAAIARAAADAHATGPGRLDLVEPADGRVRVLARADAKDRSRRRGRSGGPRRGGGAADPAAREPIVQTVAGSAFRLDAGGFWQVHRLAAATLSTAVADAIAQVAPDGLDPDAWHLDLYGGVGLLADAVAAAVGPGVRITTVESDPRASEHAGENLAHLLGARAETGRVDRWLAALAETASADQRARLGRGVVVLDPPRAGAGRDVVERIAALGPAHAVYVACDPVALARDLAIFAERGYRTDAVRGFDLFPHSHHTEAIAVLTR